MIKTLSSGAILEVTRSPFVIGHKLFKSVVKEFKFVNLKLGLKEGQTLGNLGDFELSDEAINTVKDMICTLLSSQEIEDALWDCMPRALYNKKKIDKALFDDEEAMGDYIEVAKEVMLFNLGPFRKSLESLFPNIRLPKSTSTPSLP